MIHYIQGDLFKSKAECWVNAVNCVGVMGAGVARLFRDRFPEYARAYKSWCHRGQARAGGLMFYQNNLRHPKYILSAATKNHWSFPSKIEWVESCINLIHQNALAVSLESIAIPALGCGHGGLNWSDVKPLIESKFKDSQIDVEVYEPR